MRLAGWTGGVVGSPARALDAVCVPVHMLGDEPGRARSSTRTDTFTVGDVAWRQIPAALVSTASTSRVSVVSSSASSAARTSVSATSAQRMPAAGLAPTASRVFRQRRVHVAHMWRRLRIDGGARLRHHCARFAHVRRRLVRGLPVSPAFFDPTLQDPPSHLHELFGGRSNTSWISTTSVAFFRTARIGHVIQLGVLTPSLLRRRHNKASKDVTAPLFLYERFRLTILHTSSILCALDRALPNFLRT